MTSPPTLAEQRQILIIASQRLSVNEGVWDLLPVEAERWTVSKTTGAFVAWLSLLVR